MLCAAANRTGASRLQFLREQPRLSREKESIGRPVIPLCLFVGLTRFQEYALRLFSLVKTIRIVLDFPLHGGKQETALFQLTRLCLTARERLARIGEFSALLPTFVEQLRCRECALRRAP